MAFKRAEDKFDYQEFLRHHKEVGAKCLYMFWGEEDYLISCFIEELRKLCVTEATADFDAKRLDGPELKAETLEEVLNAIPFFGGRIFVELHGVDINRCTGERFQQLFSDIPEWCTVVLTLPAGSRPDGRLALVKLIKTKGCAQEFMAQTDPVLYRWLQKRFAAHHKTIGQEAMDRLRFLSGDLMTRLMPEIDKVAARARGETVTVADVDAVAHHIPEADVFEMTKALAQGETDRAAMLMTELLSGDTEPIMITAVIAAQFRQLYAARLAADKGLGVGYVKEICGKSDYVAGLYMKEARGFSLRELRRAVRLCAETDWRLKSDNTVTGAELMEELLIRLAMNRDHACD